MNTQTNVQTVGVAGALAFIVVWLVSFFAPELAAAAPTGLEAAFTAIFSTVLGYVLPSTTLTRT